ncbi:hypothetical protein CYMTET_11323, partial [Cymbomonas tetramitiformis]
MGIGMESGHDNEVAGLKRCAEQCWLCRSHEFSRPVYKGGSRESFESGLEERVGRTCLLTAGETSEAMFLNVFEGNADVIGYMDGQPAAWGGTYVPGSGTVECTAAEVGASTVTIRVYLKDGISVISGALLSTENWNVLTGAYEYYGVECTTSRD